MYSTRARRALLMTSTTLLMGFATLAHAADPSADQAVPGSDEAVTEVVVTASGFRQKVEQAPASISVLSREQLESERHQSLAEALANVEGVDVGATAGKTGGLNISIRGMGNDYTLVLVDGRRQNAAGSVTPNGFGETASSFIPPMSAIDRIEVVRGPVSTLYGSDAMGGVINIITRKVGKVWSGSVSANATLQEDEAFGNIYGGNFYANGPLIADKLGLAVRGSYQTREESALSYQNATGATTVVSTRGPSPVENEIWAAGARLSFTPTENHDRGRAARRYDRRGPRGVL
ncbi:MAG: TonB-dependent receptor plug domain-containing protein, partial [Asticcacaulis sp.]